MAGNNQTWKGGCRGMAGNGTAGADANFDPVPRKGFSCPPRSNPRLEQVCTWTPPEHLGVACLPAFHPRASLLGQVARLPRPANATHKDGAQHHCQAAQAPPEIAVCPGNKGITPFLASDPPTHPQRRVLKNSCSRGGPCPGEGRQMWPGLRGWKQLSNHFAPGAPLD